MKTKRPAFSNGTEFMLFNEHNCDRCTKASHYNEKTDSYTKYRCAIQRELDTAYVSDGLASQRTASVTDNFTLHNIACPFLKTSRPRRRKPSDPDQTQLFEP